MTDLLLVVDLQQGFINDKTRHILPVIDALIARKAEAGGLIAFTRFINTPDSGYVKWIHWSRFMDEPDTLIEPSVAEAAQHVFDKNGYTAFIPEFAGFLAQNNITRILICGIATDSCVLKTAVDSFERGIEPVVISDACASHAGPELHEAGLKLIGRFIGRGQIRTSAEI